MVKLMHNLFTVHLWHAETKGMSLQAVLEKKHMGKIIHMLFAMLWP